MTAIFKPKQCEELETRGLKDGVKYQLECRDCGKPLVIIWSVNEDFRFRDGTPHIYNYKAKCPYCGGYSEAKRVIGEVRFLEIVEETEFEDGRIVEKHHTKFNNVEPFAEEELCLITMDRA